MRDPRPLELVSEPRRDELVVERLCLSLEDVRVRRRRDLRDERVEQVLEAEVVQRCELVAGGHERVVGPREHVEVAPCVDAGLRIRRLERRDDRGEVRRLLGPLSDPRVGPR